MPTSYRKIKTSAARVKSTPVNAQEDAQVVKQDIGKLIANAKPETEVLDTIGMQGNDADTHVEESLTKRGPNDDCIIMEGDITAVPFPGGSGNAVNVGDGTHVLATTKKLVKSQLPAFTELQFKGNWFFNLGDEITTSSFKYVLDKVGGELYHPATFGQGSLQSTQERLANLCCAKHGQSICAVNPVFYSCCTSNTDDGNQKLDCASVNESDKYAAGKSALNPSNSLVNDDDVKGVQNTATSSSTTATTSSSADAGCSKTMSTSLVSSSDTISDSTLDKTHTGLSWKTAFLTGEWVGEFMMSKKPKTQQQVKERFFLRQADATDDIGHGSNAPTTVDVIGKGKNRFGLFDIEGAFDFTTGHLRFAKYYTVTDPTPKNKKSRKRKKKTGNTATSKMARQKSNKDGGRRSSRKRTASTHWTTDLGADTGPQHLTCPKIVSEKANDKQKSRNANNDAKIRNNSKNKKRSINRSNGDSNNNSTTRSSGTDSTKKSRGRMDVNVSNRSSSKHTSNRGSRLSQGKGVKSNFSKVKSTKKKGKHRLTAAESAKRESKLAHMREQRETLDAKLIKQGYIVPVDHPAITAHLKSLASPKRIIKSPEGRGPSSQCDICDRVVHPCGFGGILECTDCRIRVHPRCYGITEENRNPPIGEHRGSWRCDWCTLALRSRSARHPPCIVCGRKDGAVKVTSDLRWCCVSCAYWTECLTFLNPTTLEPIVYIDPKANHKVPFEEMPRRLMSGRQCTVCHKSTGILQPCAHSGCSQWMHPRCARCNGFFMEALDSKDAPQQTDMDELLAAAAEVPTSTIVLAALRNSSGNSVSCTAASLFNAAKNCDDPERAALLEGKGETLAKRDVALARQAAMKVDKMVCQMYCKYHTDKILARRANEKMSGEDNHWSKDIKHREEMAQKRKEQEQQQRQQQLEKQQQQELELQAKRASKNRSKQKKSNQKQTRHDARTKRNPHKGRREVSKGKNPKVNDDQKLLYEGQVQDGLPHGYGVFVYTELGGHMYECEWKVGQWHGWGVLSDSKNRIFFAGHFENGQCNGQGSYFHENGSVYCGTWKNNKCHGPGTFIDAQGHKYMGMWKRNVRDGPGTCFYATGLIYEGEWRNNDPQGAGVCRTDDGFFFEGHFNTGYVEGRGQCTFPDQTVYKGSFRHGKKEGRGTLQFSNGAIYEGSFRDDMTAGGSIGTFTLPVPFECILDSRGDMHMSEDTYLTLTASPTVAGKESLVATNHSKKSNMKSTSTEQTDSSDKPKPRRSKRRRNSISSVEGQTAEDADDDKDQDFDEAEAKRQRGIYLPEGVSISDYLWMIPIAFSTDMTHIHSRAGFTLEGD
jgi:hypothetical protein